MKDILSVVVGSRLHGLHQDTSDTDIRGIFQEDIEELISPFRTPKTTHWTEGDEDNTSYELRHFCKMAVQGNPTILEILWSNQVVHTTPAGTYLQMWRHDFLDSHNIYEAHKGYAHNQYKKMNLFEPDARTPKFAVAYLRSLRQGIDLLLTGDFSPQVAEGDKEFLMEVKYSWNPGLIPVLSRKFAELQVEFADVYAQNHDRLKPDIGIIEEFLLGEYTQLFPVVRPAWTTDRS